jgi:uncharacterized protein
VTASSSHFLAPLLEAAEVQSLILNSRTGTPLARRIEAAFDSKSRRRGLLGRDGLESGTALIIAPCNSIHTFFMRFAIDVVFVSRAGRVVKVYRWLKPWRIGFAAGAFATIELAAGEIERSLTHIGDTLLVTPARDGSADRPRPA